MIRAFVQRLLRVLYSPLLAAALLGFVGAWSIAGSFIAQGDADYLVVKQWAASHAAWEPLVRALDLHHAFTTPLFVGAVSLLILSTAACAWRRTRVAWTRMRSLLEARTWGATELGGVAEVKVDLPAQADSDEALESVSAALKGLGLRPKRSGDIVHADSSPFGVWGSAIFHWSLVALFVFVVVGNLQRSDGLIGLAVGQSKPLAQASFGELSAGPWHVWSEAPYGLRLDAFEARYKVDDLEIGPTPIVSVLDPDGAVVKTQPVYPNSMLHFGSYAVYAPAFGAAVTLSLTDMSGQNLGDSVYLVDFDQAAPDGSTPTEPGAVLDSTGNVAFMLHVTTPLTKENGKFVEWLRKDQTAHVVATDAAGKVIADRILAANEVLTLPGGLGIKLVDIGWYSRLSVVDDWTTPFIYACMVLACAGLAISLLMRQHVIAAGIVQGANGPLLAAHLRLWRNAPASRREVEQALQGATGRDSADVADPGPRTPEDLE